mmetsp:Transcript_16495/g.34040  ORF Transcript_16495/g.34040 Transcript_16495/m.34040 type:complete len:280 (+) Transcript_16495:187-1026(+)
MSSTSKHYCTKALNSIVSRLALLIVPMMLLIRTVILIDFFSSSFDLIRIYECERLGIELYLLIVDLKDLLLPWIHFLLPAAKTKVLCQLHLDRLPIVWLAIVRAQLQQTNRSIPVRFLAKSNNLPLCRPKFACQPRILWKNSKIAMPHPNSTCLRNYHPKNTNFCLIPGPLPIEPMFRPPCWGCYPSKCLPPIRCPQILPRSRLRIPNIHILLPPRHRRHYWTRLAPTRMWMSSKPIEIVELIEIREPASRLAQRIASVQSKATKGAKVAALILRTEMA